MKKRFRKVAAIISAVAIAFSVVSPVSAYAADIYEWGKGWFTPYQASVKFHKTYVQGSNMKWDVTQIARFHNSSCWELEFRPELNEGAVEPADIYVESAGGNLVTTLPNAYYEFDPDDVSIGCNRCSSLVAETSYMGTLYLTSNYSGTINYKALIESEYGNWNAVRGDGLPLYYEQWHNNEIPIGSGDNWSR